ncbi:hypothetical protein [Luteimonas deserti]
MAVTLAGAHTAHAQDSQRFTLSGFGTVGLVHSTEDKADFRGDFQITRGVGASQQTSMKPDSRIALQLNARFTDDFTGLVQVVSEHAITESYKPQVSLAHVKYRVSPDFTARLGRITAPLYMLSEYQRVGYATPWVRPPYEVYNYLVPLDGVEGLYTINAGDTVVGLQGFYGRIDSELVRVDAMRGLAVQLDRGAHAARVSHIRGRVGVSSPSVDRLFDTYRSLPVPGLASIAARLDPRSLDGSFTGVGYSYDPGAWFLRTEAIQADYTPSLSARTTSGYISAGMRRGTLTPSLTFAHVDTDGVEMPGAADPFGLLNMAVASSNAGRHSYTAALRWDVRDSVALKLQGSHIENHAGSFGSLGNVQPGFQPGRSYNLISASVDFVF